MKPVFTGGLIQGFNCDCGYYFDVAVNIHCWNCGRKSPASEEYRVKLLLKRRGEDIPLNDTDLFMTLFNSEKIAVKDLDFPALRERKEELKKIISEAKIRVAAIDDEERQRLSKVPKEKREWLVTGNSVDPTTSDAIVKQRKARMSKADKLAGLLGSIGLSDDDELLTKVERKVTGGAITSSIHRKMVDKPVRTESEDSGEVKKAKPAFSFTFKKN